MANKGNIPQKYQRSKRAGTSSKPMVKVKPPSAEKAVKDGGIPLSERNFINALQTWYRENNPNMDKLDAMTRSYDSWDYLQGLKDRSDGKKNALMFVSKRPDNASTQASMTSPRGMNVYRNQASRFSKSGKAEPITYYVVPDARLWELMEKAISDSRRKK